MYLENETFIQTTYNHQKRNNTMAKTNNRQAAPANEKAAFPAFHALRISHKAFLTLNKKRLDAMQGGKRSTLSEIANAIIEGA